ncbi:MAG: polysaccharide biosynthesis tyrosine autokinase [Peptostreptococcaceae bacterium]
MENKLGLREIINIIKQKWWVILVFLIISILLSTFISSVLITPIYQSNTKLIVYNNKNKANTDITTSDIEVNTKLASTYSEIIKSKSILERVISELNLKMSYENLYNNIKIDNIDDTGIVNIFVNDKNPENAYNIANKIPAVFDEEIKKIMNVENVSILEKASLGKYPILPNTFLNIFISIILGLFAGLIYIFAQEYSDKKIRYKKNTICVEGIDILGSIPYSKRKEVNQVKESELIYMNLDINRSILLYKDIIKNIEFSNVDKKIKSILFSSCNKSEGKSVIISDLAIFLSNMYKKILIIDFNLVNPTIHKTLEIDQSVEVLDLLLEGINFNGYIKKSSIDNLDVLLIGDTPSKSSDLLKSDVIKNLMENIKNNNMYDYILIDTPSTSTSLDVDIISSYTDSAIIIVEDKKTKKSKLLELKHRLFKNNIKILGIIVNKVK